ncbi:sensor histidine kinase [Corynebacterium glucuronolyticum]|uniref:sensor histidine kinase n=1 Tax=Corynebacterium glucuronolyticum TaxID=39791 RepID=UPI00223A977C|nr:HAMP domain-containing sensor histidine kinase [Corynebacterium glucuronolyticum]MCT1563828.1 HAMP domain-containing histidine kinase [Corynebacterium glucuronolyticum]
MRVPRTKDPTSRISLNASLVILVLALAIVAIGGTGIVVTAIMRDFTYSRVDERLIGAVNGWAWDVYPAEEPLAHTRPPSNFYVQRQMPNGDLVVMNDRDSAPDLSTIVTNGQPYTVDPAAGSNSSAYWRVLAVRTGGTTTVVAQSLEEEQSTVKNLIKTQASIGLSSLLLVALIAILVIYRALRPLRTVESVAQAITDGDMNRRVPAWPQTTEVGKLACAINTMLEQLQDSLQKSRRQEKEMRQFVGDASHELRTPLTSVKGFAELYKTGATDDADWVLSKIQEEAGRMTTLVEDLLALTRAEGNPLDKQKVDLMEVIESLGTSLRVAYPDREITIGESEPLYVLADEEKIRRVFTNLMVNGLVHGGKDVSVLPTADDTDVIIDVRDNGQGMAPEDLEHIFDRFYRTDESRSRQSGGSGLGLSIAKSLVEAHGGSLSVTSTKGVGSTFTVRLPRLIDEESA